MTNSKEKICERYECGQPYFYTLPEVGNLCKGCYLEMHEDAISEAADYQEFEAYHWED
tara:strand:+ start:436 stop:609 length:174 start_codon:yes stop_codon:yes gene_type:complete